MKTSTLRSLLKGAKYALPAIVLAFAAALTAAGQDKPADPPQALVPGKAIEGRIKAGVVRNYQFDLKKGQFASVTVEQQPGYDLIVSIFGPDGKMLADMNAKFGYLWTQTVSAIAPVPGTYRVEVKTPWTDSPEGVYSIALTKPRKAKDPDVKRVAAEKEFSEGRRIYMRNEPPDAAASAVLFEKAAALWKEAGDKYWQAIGLINAGWSLGDAGLLTKDKALSEKGIKLHTEALAIFESIRNVTGQGKAVNAIGLIQHDLKQYEPAIESYKKAIVFRRAANDMRGVWIALQNIANAYDQLGRKDDAIAFLRQVIDVKLQLNEKLGTLGTLLAIAKLEFEAGREEKAAAICEEVVDHLKKRNVRDYSASSIYFDVAALYNNHLRNFNKAVEYYELSAIIGSENGDRIAEAMGFIAVGGTYNFGLKDYSKAKSYFEKALAAVSLETRAKTQKSLAQFGLGNVAENQKDYVTALVHYNAGLVIAIDSGDRNTRNLNRSGLAGVYQKLREFDKARAYYEQDIAEAEKVGDSFGVGSTLNNLGGLYVSLNQFDTARETYQKALKFHRIHGNKVNEGLALAGLGLLHINLNEFDEAISIYDQQLKLSLSIQNKPNIYLAYLGLGQANAKSSRYDEAEKHYLATVGIAREMNDRPGEANTLVELGNMYADISLFEKSQALQEEALGIFRAIGDKNGESSALNNIGRALYGRGEYREANPYFEKALALKKEIGEKVGLEVLLSNMGGVKSNLNEYEPAKGYYDQATEAAKDVRNQVMEGLIEGYKGRVYFNDRNQYERAIPLFEKSLEMSVKIKNKRGEAGALDNLGTASLELGRYDDARDYYERSLAISRQIKDRLSEAGVLGRLGNIYIQIGNYVQARNFYDEALLIQQSVKNRHGVGLSSMALGVVARETGDLENARELLLRSLGEFREIGVPRDEGHALYHLAKVESAMKRNEKAREHLQNALTIFRSIKDRRQEGRALNSFGQIFRNLGQFAEAKTRHQTALGIFREIKARQEEGDTLRDLMETSVSEGSSFMAVAYGKKAIEAYQEVRGNIKKLDAESQQSFVREKEAAYRMLADQLISQGRIPEAQIVLGLLKREEFSKPLTREGPDALMPYTNADSRLLGQIEKLIPLEKELVDLEQVEAAKRDDIKINDLKKQIAEINRALDTALKELAESAKRDGPGKIEEIQEGLKNRRSGGSSLKSVLTALGSRERSSKVVALYTVLGEQNRGGKAAKFGWMIMVTETGHRAYPIDISDLESLVSQFRTALTDTSHDPAPVAQAIYKAMFRQRLKPEGRTLEEDLDEYLRDSREKTLMWSLDGVLRYIPMAALHDGEGYLVEKYRNVVLTNKNFDALSAKKTEKWRVLGLGVSEERERFRALPGVKRELENIVRLPYTTSGIFDGSISLDGNFRKGAFFNDVGSRNYPVVHIASHYSFNAGRPGESYLLVGDGRVTFDEMVAESEQSPNPLFAGVDLLTLSACDTAVSGNGKENEGFAVTAQDLGAKSVLASLWPVSDDGTAELMVRFYGQIATEKGISKGEAFQRAQLAVSGAAARPFAPSTARKRGVEPVSTSAKIGLPQFVKDKNRPFAHPHYWASFVLIGNWL